VAYRVRSLLQGEIIACQGIASRNITLSVDTGPDGAACLINNLYPANFEPLPADLSPTVIGINPLNGQPNVPVTTSVVAAFTPPSACITADTWNNIVTAPIGGDPAKGLEVLSAKLISDGTFYLEELDNDGKPVRHIPTDLTVENPTAGGTTIAVLRLGLPDPLSQAFLKPNTRYRATLVGGTGGICSDSSGAEMPETFSWTFSTAQDCSITGDLSLLSVVPDSGSIEQPLNQPIVLNFTNRIDLSSLRFIQGDLQNSTIGFYKNATESGGDLVDEGMPVQGRPLFSNLNTTLTYTPIPNLPEDTQIHIRLTSGVRDVCGNLLQTPANGVKLSSFQTVPPDTTPPDAPSVNTVPVLTNQPSIQVSGSAEPFSIITVMGGSSPVNTTTSESGLFSVIVPLNLDETNNLQVQAVDASGNVSIIVTNDKNGTALMVANDNTPPVVTSIVPADGANGVPLTTIVSVIFDEPINPDTINSLNFALEANGDQLGGSFTQNGAVGFIFTPDEPLAFDTLYNVSLRANGIRDLAGNGLTGDFITEFNTELLPPPVITNATPNSGVQGTTFQISFSGSNLATAQQVISDNPGISGSIINATGNSVVADITIDSLAVTGLTTLGVMTLNGNATVAFTVEHKAPVINAIIPDYGIQGEMVSGEILGSGLSDIISISASGDGVIITAIGIGDDARRDIQIQIADDADPGIRIVTFTTPGGTTTTTFEVISSEPPTITAVNPSVGSQGQMLDITVTGSALGSARAIISSNLGISGSIRSATYSTVEVTIYIASNAATGLTDIGIQTVVDTATINFEVQPSGRSVRVAQESSPGAGDFDTAIVGFLTPIQADISAAAYYSYGVPNRASYNGIFPPATSQTTSLFFVNASDGLHLFLVHDKANDGSGGSFRSRLELTGANAALVVRDDATESNSSGGGTIFTGNHTWSACCTDGMVIGSLPDAGWSMTAEVTATPSNITRWEGVSDDGSKLPLAFQVGRRIRFDMLDNPPTESIPIAQYSFEGDFTDSSGHSLDGTGVGTLSISNDVAPFTTTGFSSLDARSDFDYVQVDDDALLPVSGDFTVEAFVKPYNNIVGGGVNPHVIVSKQNFEGGGNFLDAFNIFYNQGVSDNPFISGKVGAFAASIGFGGNAGEVVESASTFDDNEWHHVAETYQTLDSGQALLSLYVDGIPEGLKAFTARPIFFGDEPLYIGAGNYNLSAGQTYRRNFVGLIDEVRISDTALTPDKFLNNPSTVFYYHYDTSVMPNHSTLQNIFSTFTPPGTRWSASDGELTITTTDLSAVNFGNFSYLDPVSWEWG
jgi:hypothetical protein